MKLIDYNSDIYKQYIFLDNIDIISEISENYSIFIFFGR